MRTAYVTTLCNGEGYLPGVEALGSSLKASGTREPMVLMVTPEIRPTARDRLAGQGWTVREIEPIAHRPCTACPRATTWRTSVHARAFERLGEAAGRGEDRPLSGAEALARSTSR